MVPIITAICLGVCLSAACGLRVFLPFLIVSVAAKFGLLELRDGWQWLGSWSAITAFSTATVLEITAYYVPWIDNLLDSIATPAAGIAGMLMTVAVMPADMSALNSWCLGIIAGGGAATGVQLVTVGARALSSASTGGLGNHIVSTGEALGALGILISALFAPIVIAAIVITAFGIMVYFVIRKGGTLFFSRKTAA
ncbi:MAG: DUF4126 domain-containing protein [Lentisphaerae bacterium]|nr:DUF4126 domain-containing protein [Lentisphaerota bacterium]